MRVHVLPQEGNTVPYQPFRDHIRNNRGFTDLRGRPSEAAKVVAGRNSRELGEWLVDLATTASRLFSLGCDIGTFRRREAVPRPHATGGYVQLVAADYASRSIEDYTGLAERMSIPVRRAADLEDWEALFRLQTVRLNLDGHGKEVESLSVEFNAWARTAAEATASRERLVRLLRQACASDPVFGRTSD